MSKRATLMLSSESDLVLFKQFKDTYCVGMTNSEVLRKLISIGQDNVGEFNCDEPSGYVTKDELAAVLEPINVGGKRMYDMITSLSERVATLERVMN